MIWLRITRLYESLIKNNEHVNQESERFHSLKTKSESQ